MRLPRDLSGEELAKKLQALGFEPTRQTGSHLRLTRKSPEADSHVTVPLHKNLRVGTLNAIVSDVSRQFGVSKLELLRRLFG